MSNFDNTVQNSNTPGLRPGLPGSGPGGWNDPDMIGTGMPGITDTEGRSQFSLWCILGAPLFLGADLRNMSQATFATISSAEAIAINQEASVEGARTFSPAGEAPRPRLGQPAGDELFFINQTYCRGFGTSWILNSSSGELASLSSPLNKVRTGLCGTIASFDLSSKKSCTPEARMPVVAGECGNSACDSQLRWAFNASRVVLNHQSLLWADNTWCLEAVDPASNPASQFVLNTCTAGTPGQNFSYADYTGRLSLPMGTFGREKHAGGQPCVGAFAPNDIDMFIKRMDNGDVALAVLNRGGEDAPPQPISMARLGYAPAQRISVRDIWANTTDMVLGKSSFLSRPIARHETILLRLSTLSPGRESTSPQIIR